MKRKSILLVAAGLLLLGGALALSQATPGDFRTWTDRSGNYRVEAALVELQGDSVVLQRRDGQQITVPLERLSRGDQLRARRAARETRTTADDAEAELTTSVAAGPDFDWPQWRGPNRDGISSETGLLDQWPSEGPPLLWTVSGLGSGYSSVAVAGGKIFTLGQIGGETRMIALDLSDGTRLWQTRVGGGGAPNCTPTVDGDLVYGLSHGGDLLCADTATGTAVWSKNFARDFGGKMMSGWGYSESPLVDGQLLVCTPGSNRAMLAAMDKRTGDVRWTTAMPDNAGSRGQDGAGYSSIVISHAAGVRQYIQLVGRGLIGVDAANGRLLWGYNRIANGTANIPTPLVKGEYVFCSSGYGTGAALLRLVGRRGQITPQEVYFKSGNELQNHHGGMILLGDNVFLGHGHNNGFPVCVDMLSGRDHWRPGRGPGSGSAAIAMADGHLYLRYQNGVMALVEATPREYRLKGSFRIAINNGESWPHPVIANGRLYLRDQDELACYDVRER